MFNIHIDSPSYFVETSHIQSIQLLTGLESPAGKSYSGCQLATGAPPWVVADVPWLVVYLPL